jgi:hypothetical protein
MIIEKRYVYFQTSNAINFLFVFVHCPFTGIYRDLVVSESRQSDSLLPVTAVISEFNFIPVNK